MDHRQIQENCQTSKPHAESVGDPPGGESFGVPVQGCLYIPLLHTPWTDEPKRPADVDTSYPSPQKGYYIPLIKRVGNHGSQRVCTSTLRPREAFEDNGGCRAFARETQKHFVGGAHLVSIWVSFLRVHFVGWFYKRETILENPYIETRSILVSVYKDSTKAALNTQQTSFSARTSMVTIGSWTNPAFCSFRRFVNRLE